jgi:hypothetical protein
MAIYTFYKICCNEENEFVYVGSTKNFTSRKNQHKRSCEKPKQQELNTKIYVTIREFGGWENWTMTPIENFECATKLEARIREQHWIDLLKPNLNCYNAFGVDVENRKENKKEYYEKNLNKMTQYYKEYSLTNKARKQENYKKWYILTYEDQQLKRKKYREDNTEIINQKKKEYYNNNRDHINELRAAHRKINRDKINYQAKQRRIANREKNNETVSTVTENQSD